MGRFLLLQLSSGLSHSDAGQLAPFHVGVEVVGVDDFEGVGLASKAGAEWVRIVFVWVRVQADPIPGAGITMTV